MLLLDDRIYNDSLYTHYNITFSTRTENSFLPSFLPSFLVEANERQTSDTIFFKPERFTSRLINERIEA